MTRMKAIARCTCCGNERECTGMGDMVSVAGSAVAGRILALVKHLSIYGPVTLDELISNAEPDLNPRGGELSYGYVRVMVSHAHREMTKTMAGITVMISTKLRDDKQPVLFFYAHPDSGWSRIVGMEPHNALRDRLTG